MRITAFAFALVATAACNKGPTFQQPDGGGGDHPDGSAGGPDAAVGTITPTPVGVPIGLPASTTIGVDGDILYSADGVLELDVPAGALAQDAAITITPIIDNASLGVADAWRIEPAGLTFQQPATLVFHLPATAVAADDTGTLFVAAQDAQGYWQAQGAATWDGAAGTATADATVTTLGDFALTSCTGLVTDRQLVLSPAVAHLAVVSQCQTPPSSGAVGGAVPVTSAVTWTNQAGGGTGLGTLTPSGATATLTPPDTAPTDAPDTIVTASTSVVGLRSARPVSLQQTLAMAGFIDWNIEGNDYFATYGGNVITSNGTTSINGSDFTHNAALAIGFPGTDVGTFDATLAHAEVQGTSQLVYTSSYTIPCTQNQKTLTQTVGVTKASTGDHVMFGRFEGTLAIVRGTRTCPTGDEPDVVEVPLYGNFDLLWATP